MKRFALLCLALLGFALPAAAAPAVWLQPSLSRVAREAPAQNAPTLDLYAAKGETEGFQVAVRGPATGVRLVLPTSADLTFSCYIERYLYARGSGAWSSQTNKPGGAGWYPDALEPGSGPVAIAEGQTQPFWVDVTVGRSATPGVRALPVQVVSDQGTATVSINLRIWDFTIPLKPALRSAFLTWGTRKQIQPDKLLLAHRVNPYLLDKTQEATLMATLGLQSSHLGYFSEVGSAVSINPPPSQATLQAAVASHPPGLWLYNYTADEITGKTALYPMLKTWHKALDAVGVQQLITMVPDPLLWDDGAGKPAVDTWVVLPKQDQASRPLMDTALAKGCTLWSYNTLSQDDYSPKWLVDFAPINCRIQPGFSNFTRGMTGLLYWSVDKWTSDPWHDLGTGQQGDGLLVYPWQGGTAPSIRLKRLRDGVDDYDYLTLLKAKDPTKAKLLSSSVAFDWKTWTRDPLLLESTRRQIGEALSEVVAPPPPPPPPPAPAHTLTAAVTLSARSVRRGKAITCKAAATDCLPHTGFAYAWSDGGGGGRFSSPTSKESVYTAPTSPKTVTISLTVTCKWQLPWVSATAARSLEVKR